MLTEETSGVRHAKTLILPSPLAPSGTARLHDPPQLFPPTISTRARRAPVADSCTRAKIRLSSRRWGDRHPPSPPRTPGVGTARPRNEHHPERLLPRRAISGEGDHRAKSLCRPLSRTGVPPSTLPCTRLRSVATPGKPIRCPANYPLGMFCEGLLPLSR